MYQHYKRKYKQTKVVDMFKNISYISGIIRMIIYFYNDCYFILLADSHFSKNECKNKNNVVKIENLAKEINKNLPSSIIDFYIENMYDHLSKTKFTPPESTNITTPHQSEYTIDRVRDKYKDCLIDKKKCPKNIRIHATDIRYSDKLFIECLNLFYETPDLLNQIQTKNNYKKIKNVIDEFLNFSKKTDFVINFKQIKSFILNIMDSDVSTIIDNIITDDIYKYKKSFELLDPIIVNIGLNYLTNYLSNFKKDQKQKYYIFDPLYKALKKSDNIESFIYHTFPQNINNSDIYPTLNNFYHSMTIILNLFIYPYFTVLMDVYTFYRMHRKMNKQPQKYVIYYAGDAHITNLSNMFGTIYTKLYEGNTKDYKPKMTDNQLTKINKCYEIGSIQGH